jgi:hypothetical protein
MTIDNGHKNKMKAAITDIKRFMMRNGLKPSPLEFIRLVQLDPDF